MKEDAHTHASEHDNPYDWITPDYRLKWTSDLEQLRGDHRLATSGNALSWIKKGYVTKQFVGDAIQVLDIGCGWGRNLAQLEGAVGVDIDWALLRTAQTYVGNPLVTADCYRLPFRDGAFDAVVMTEVIEHLDNPEGVLSEVRRVLSDRGRFVITTPNRAVTRFASVPGHMKEFYFRELSSLLKSVGFEVLARSGSTIPYPPRYHPLTRRLDRNPFVFRLWKLIDLLLSPSKSLKWDLIVLARPQSSGR